MYVQWKTPDAFNEKKKTARDFVTWFYFQPVW